MDPNEPFSPRTQYSPTDPRYPASPRRQPPERSHSHPHLIHSPYHVPLLPVLHPVAEPTDDRTRKGSASSRFREQTSGTAFGSRKLSGYPESDEDTSLPKFPSDRDGNLVDSRSHKGSTESFGEVCDLGSRSRSFHSAEPSPRETGKFYKSPRLGSFASSFGIGFGNANRDEPKEQRKGERKHSREFSTRIASKFKNIFKNPEDELDAEPIRTKNWTDEDYWYGSQS